MANNDSSKKKSGSQKSRADLLAALKDFYQDFDKDKIKDLKTIYHEDVTFQDPISLVNGRKDLETYLGHSMGNINYCRFAFDHEISDKSQAFLTWQMRFSHPKILDGAEVVVPGTSHIIFDEDESNIRQHIDYYDVGAMVYEHVPIIGWLIGKVKNRLEPDLQKESS